MYKIHYIAIRCWLHCCLLQTGDSWAFSQCTELMYDLGTNLEPNMLNVCINSIRRRAWFERNPSRSSMKSGDPKIRHCSTFQLEDDGGGKYEPRSSSQCESWHYQTNRTHNHTNTNVGSDESSSEWRRTRECPWKTNNTTKAAPNPTS